MDAKGRCGATLTAVLLALAAASAAYGQEQTKDQQKCINKLNKDASKVAAAQGKENAACVKAGTKGTAASNCLTADVKGKVAKKTAKTAADETKGDCLGANAPSFGYTSAAAANAAAVDEEVNLFADVYGTTDPSAVISTDKLIGKCQAAVTKDVEKIAATKFKQYLKCKKDALKNGATSAAALEACVSGDPNSIAADPKGKIGKKVAKLGADITKKCTGVTQSAAFPGACASAGDLTACLDEQVECRVCLMINAIDGLAVDCDLFDDGAANGSCGGPAPTCPQGPGRYTQTTTGGTLRVATFAPFPFPAGGETVQDVGPGDANCVHTTVIPFPGGLTVPTFCVPALGATTQVTQTGCGIGRIDSDGGSDFTVTENGDTSEDTICGVAQGVCPAAGPAPDSSGRLDITVGDGVADTCDSGTGNAIVTIPVNTLTWVASDASCPDTDETFDEGTDTKLAEFPQTLDLTTDTATAQFVDLDGDACSRSGLGPNGPFSNTGTCLDLNTSTVSVAASGTIFSSGGPTFDLLFTTLQDSTVSGPAPSGGATCPSPPLINFNGTANRCLVAP